MGEKRFITHREKNLIGSLMLKKGINDKAISRQFAVFLKVADFRNFMAGKKFIEESYIESLISWLKSV